MATLLAFLVVGAPAAGAASNITEFGGLTPGAEPSGITAGPDGALWFTESGEDQIGRITPVGAVTEFGGLNVGKPNGIALGPDRSLWFTERKNPGAIGRITPGGVVTEFTAGLRHDSDPFDIAAGTDGNLWFTERANPGRIGRITPAGTITEFSAGLTQDRRPQAITAGPDGNLWFTEAKGAIGRITPAGEITEFTVGLTPDSEPADIAAGPDGNLWFTESANAGRVGRITPSGVITEFATGLTPFSAPASIAAGPDGNLWFTESAGFGAIARITPAGAITEFRWGLTASSAPAGVTAGPDGAIWFTERADPGRIGRISLAPAVSSVWASAVADTYATLAAKVSPNSRATTYHFEYGTTIGYGRQTPEQSAGSGAGPQAVSTPVAGLAPNTTYHVRAVATSAAGRTVGDDASFKTGAPGAAPVTPDSVTDDPGAVAAATPRPRLGSTVVVAAVRGKVSIRPAGSGGAMPLGAASAAPIDSIVDAREGTVRLTTALDATGRAQSATFHGAIFRVSQARDGRGMTDIALRGGNFSACARPANRIRAARAADVRPVRALWGSDHNGRFRTHGRNSVATVRGTKWVTVDRCSGTATRVTQGKVLVRDLGAHRTVLVTAGHSYLARSRR